MDSRGLREYSLPVVLHSFLAASLADIYDSGLAPDTLSAPAIYFYALLCSFLTGVWSAWLGFASSVNMTANIRDVSGPGLSALLFSTISHIFFAGSASPLLLLLSWGFSFPMILGFFDVKS